MALRGPRLSLALLLAACSERADDDRPLDGGHPLGEPVGSYSPEGLVNRDCFRAERGRWHYSVGHCEAMLPAGRIEGVWVTAFEESSFFPGAAIIPDANDPRRFITEIELDHQEVIRSSGYDVSEATGEAYQLTFVGRRTRDPWFDCHGVPSFTFVVDRLIRVQHLGAMKPSDRSGAVTRLEAYAKQVRGRWGKAQAEAIKRCADGAPRSSR